LIHTWISIGDEKIASRFGSIALIGIIKQWKF
jgi:hypothetical protein